MLKHSHSQRGQALMETALFVPIMLLAIFSLIYFSRYTVINERAQQALRYGALVSYEQAPVFSIRDIYAAVQGGGQAALNCPANVSTDMAAALTQNGTAQTYWKPDGATSTGCTISTASFGGSSFEAFHFFTVTQAAVGAPVNVPNYLKPIVGSTTGVSARTAFAHSDPPGVIMYCASKVGMSVSVGLEMAYNPPAGAYPC